MPSMVSFLGKPSHLDVPLPSTCISKMKVETCHSAHLQHVVLAQRADEEV